MNKKIISWQEYFMGLAHLSALRSKDPNTKVGACIVDDLNRVISIGYNGFPRGCDDNLYPWGREGDFIETKYPYVVHAELNAILNSKENLKNATIYVTLFPCNECAKAIIQAGIKKIYYQSDKYADTPIIRASKRMLDSAGVEYFKVNFNLELNLDIKELDS